MSLSIGVGGAWKTVSAASIGVGGVWKTVATIWIGVAGAWKQIFAALNLPATITVSDVEIAGDAFASVTFNAAGTYTSVGNDSSPSGTWLVAGSGSDYEIMAHLESGDTPTGTLDSWLALSSNRSWSVTDSTIVGGPVGAVMTVSIGLAGTSIALDSTTVTLSASKESA